MLMPVMNHAGKSKSLEFHSENRPDGPDRHPLHSEKHHAPHPPPGFGDPAFGVRRHRTGGPAIAESRGWELRDLEPVAKGMADMVTRARLSGGCTDSRIAAMMITGSTKGMVKGLQQLHQFNRPDPQVSGLSQKLLDWRKRRHPADAELSLKRKKPPVPKNRGLCHGLWNYLLRFLMENQRAAARTAEVIRTRVVMATSKVSPVAGVTVCLSPQSLHLPSEP